MKQERQFEDYEIEDAQELNRKLDQAKKTESAKPNNQVVAEILSREESNRWTEASKNPEGMKAHKRESQKTTESMARKADFYLREWQEKTGNRSRDMETAFRNLECQTFGDMGWGRVQKSLLGFEIGERIEKAGATSQDTVYLGASSDIHFPLAMRARNIKLVDPVFAESPEVKDALKTEIEKYGECSLEERDGLIYYAFQFDFGSGKEDVCVVVSPVGAEKYQAEQPIGALLSFKGNGRTVPFSFPRIDSHLTAGSYIYDSDQAGFASEILNEIVERKGDYSDFTPEEHQEFETRVQQAAGKLGLRAIFIPGLEMPVYQLAENPDLLVDYAQAEQAKREERDRLSPSLSELRAAIKDMPLGSLTDNGAEQDIPENEIE